MSTNETRPEVTTYRVSPQQELQCASRGFPMCGIVQAIVELPAGPTEDDVRGAVRHLVERHEILRTTFVRQPGMRTLGQLVHDELEPAWESENWPRPEPLLEGLDDLLAEDAASPLDAEAGPVVRARLVTSDRGGSRVLLLAVARPCADVPSLALIATELTELLAGADPAAEPLQYADYAEWRHELLSDEEAASDARAFWQSQAVEPSPRVLFSDPHAASGVTRRLAVPLSAEVLAEGARVYRTTSAVFLEACWHACIARVAGVEEVVAGAVTDGREHEELRDAVGPYAHLLPLRTSTGSSFAELVDQVTRARAQLERRQDYAEAPLLLTAGEALTIGFAERPRREPRVLRAAGNPAGLLLELRLVGDEVELQYDASAVPDEDALQLAGHVAAIAESAAADPEATVAGLRLVSVADRERLLAAARTPLSSPPELRVHELFERQAARFPDDVAVVAADGTVTYRTLDERANRLARQLRTLGVGPDVAVGLCMDRSTAMIEALVAILKAGGAYVPLNYEHPAERLAHQLAETRAVAVVTQSALVDRLPDFAGAVVSVDGDRAAIEAHPSDAPAVGGSVEDRVYVMYTSGSTGLPKGVEVTHRNLASYVAALLDVLQDGSGEERLSFAAVSAISTDLGNTSVFGALLSGGTLNLVSNDTAMDGALFAAYAAEQPIDVLKITPSQLRALVGGADATAVLPRRWLVLGGEALGWEVVEPLLAAAKCRILNHYGPTETTVGSCTFEVTRDSARTAATVPIGRPLANARVAVVDERLEPVLPGIPGEIVIGGHGMARGYVAQPEQTAEVFVPDPFGEPGDRVYRTGDLGRVHRDGPIEFLGRRDDQLKIRGYRVEPGEIEETLRRHPEVRDAAVAAHSVDGGDPNLVGYVISTGTPAADALQDFLRRHLPAYLVPTRFVQLDALPLTASGKVDRRALPEPGVSPRRQEYVAPRTPLEESLAAIWEELLGVQPVGVLDDFFGLGGHSLLATQVVIRIRRAHADIPLHTIFERPTIAGLAEAIEETQAAASEAVGA